MDPDHPFLTFLIDYLMEMYNKKKTLSMHPSVVGKAFQLFCKIKKKEEPALKVSLYQCSGNSTLALVHPDAFFPLKHNQTNHFFYLASLKSFDLQILEQAYLTYANFTLWGPYQVKYSSLYARMARQYCPNVWKHTLTEFIPLGF